MQLETLSTVELDTLAHVDRAIRTMLEGNDEIEITSHFDTATLHERHRNIHVTLHGENVEISAHKLPDSVDGHQIIYNQSQPKIITA